MRVISQVLAARRKASKRRSVAVPGGMVTDIRWPTPGIYERVARIQAAKVDSPQAAATLRTVPSAFARWETVARDSAARVSKPLYGSATA